MFYPTNLFPSEMEFYGSQGQGIKPKGPVQPALFLSWLVHGSYIHSFSVLFLQPNGHAHPGGKNPANGRPPKGFFRAALADNEEHGLNGTPAPK